MPFEEIDALTQLPPAVVLFGVVLSALRPFGLMFGFTAFGWALGSGGLVLRVSVAIGLSLPVIFTNVSLFPELGQSVPIFTRIVLAGKEFMLGFAFGFLASMPFHAIVGAGQLVDSYRGEQNASFTAGDGEVVSATSLLFVVAAFVTFFTTGGFWFLMFALYQSYGVWPLATTFPEFSGDALMLLVEVMGSFLSLLLRIGLPLLALLAIIEFTCIVGARFAQRFQLESNIFLYKNTVYIFALPLYSVVLVRIMEDVAESGDVAYLFLVGILQ